MELRPDEVERVERVLQPQLRALQALRVPLGA